MFLVYFFHNYAHILRVLGKEKDTNTILLANRYKLGIVIDLRH